MEGDGPDLMFAHRYAEAAAFYAAKARKQPSEPDWIAARGEALMCLGRLNEAFKCYRRAHEMSGGKRLGDRYAYRQELAAVLWMLGRRDEALDLMTSSVQGIQDGTIEYARDTLGGVSDGLLLWYAAITARDHAATQFALGFLAQRSKSKNRFTQNWPGPVVLYIQGRLPWEMVVLRATEQSTATAALRAARDDVLFRRQLVQALFYFAAAERAAGRERACRAAMKRCAALENPIIEIEWYLARADAAAPPALTHNTKLPRRPPPRRRRN
jgi:tetratricopeptide (TPR) repeat protein